MVAAGIALLLLAVLLLLRDVGRVVQRRRGVAVAPRRRRRRRSSGASPSAPRSSSRAPAERRRPGGGARPRRTLRLARPSLAGAGLGTTLVLGGGLVFLWLTGALTAARDVLLAVVVVVVAIGVILTPWWLRLVRGLTEEREERVRTQERAELAAHLHDSVLQTLALMQKRARRPARGRRPGAAPGARAARVAQRRPGRASRGARWPARSRRRWPRWRTTTACPSRSSPWATARSTSRPRRSSRRRARPSSTRSSSPPARPISVYAEADGDRVEVFVRDRGPGFDLAAVPADRRGLRESVLGRMDRHGGHAHVHTRPGAGTEIELVLPR